MSSENSQCLLSHKIYAVVDKWASVTNYPFWIFHPDSRINKKCKGGGDG